MSRENKEISEEELMLLEQLCYLDTEVCTSAGLGKDKTIVYSDCTSDTVSSILQDIDKEAIANLRAQGDQVISGGEIEASEWADIIETIKNNDKLMNLTLVDVKTNSEGKTLDNM
jgi:hypothetical protein